MPLLASGGPRRPATQRADQNDDSADAAIGEELRSLNEATGGAYQFVLSQGGEPLETLAEIQPFKAAMKPFDPAAPGGMLTESAANPLFEGHSPIGADVPPIYLGLFTSVPAPNELWLARVPYLGSRPRGVSPYSIPGPLIDAFLCASRAAADVPAGVDQRC
jgi:hypothetical protein